MDYNHCFLHPPTTTMSFCNKSKEDADFYGENAAQGREGDKPIPFLRRLIDMLQENEEIISFFPGSRNKNGQSTPGRIVVHDRAKVEAEILPRYFNHSSFASLRRQLNYFAFCRVGKGKQKGATYCNENVIDILDILLLKRRAVGSSIPVVQERNFQVSTQSSPSSTVVGDDKMSVGSSSPGHAVSIDSRSNVAVTVPIDSTKKRKRSNKKSKKTIVDSLVPVVHLPQKKAKVRSTPTWDGAVGSSKPKNNGTKKSESSVSVSPPPADSSFGNKISSGTQITLDLTKPPPSFMQYDLGTAPVSMCTLNTKEADILAGCSALLALGYHPSV